MKATRTVNAIFMGIGVLIVTSFAATYISGTHALQSNRQSNAHREVISKFDEVLSSMKDAETGVRGYLLTENASYLEPYHTA